MSNHTGNCPTDGRVLRGKRIPALKKTAPAVAREGPIPSEGILEDFRIQECVDPGLPTEKSGFALLIIMRKVSPHKHSSSCSGHSCEPGIGSCSCMRDRRWACGSVFFYGCVARHQRCAGKDQGDGPVPLRLGHVEGSGPEGLLI